jgi:nucleoside-diphosphate-sugar epimerase
MYGPTDGRELTEDLPYAASGRKGKTRSQMAKMLLAAHNAGEIRVAIGRASDFYGPGVRDSVVGEMFFVPALEGKSVNVIGDPDMPHTYTYICDFARALVTLSEHEEAYGRAWHVPSAPTISTRQFADLTAAEIGRPVNLRPGGRLSLTLIGLFVPEVREMKELLYEFEEPFVVNHKQYATSFGNGSTPHDQAIRETTAWFQQRGYSKDH